MLESSKLVLACVCRVYLPGLFVFSICVSLDICLRKAILSQLNALLNCFLDLEDVYGRFV